MANVKISATRAVRTGPLGVPVIVSAKLADHIAGPARRRATLRRRARIDTATFSLLINRRSAAAAAFALLLAIPVAGAENATLTWRGTSHPIATSPSGDFRVIDVARALGFEASADPASGVLDISGHGHKIFVGAGTTQVPVDQRIVSISRPATVSDGALFAPPDFFEKVLFPLAGASGSYDPARRLWALTAGGAVSLEVAVVHVAPATQVVLRQSGPARFVPTVTDTGFQIRWPDQTVVPPFAERRYEDPFVSAIRFSTDAATIEFREPGLAARAYPLSGPDRLVVEIGRPGTAESAPVPSPPQRLSPSVTVVLDPGHGGTETGAIGAGGLQEKDATLAIARRIAAALPRAISCRVVLTRDSDSAISLDDRTSVANHEKADLFLSIHANSSRIAGAHGSETYYLSLEASDRLAQEAASRENEGGAPGANPSSVSSTSPALDFILWDLAQSAHLKESSELAEAIQEELNVVSATENRGIKQAPFRVLVGATMPAVLVETAFISNPDEEKRLASSAFQQNVADAVAKAVARFFSRRRPAVVRIPLEKGSPPPSTPSR